MTWRPEDFDDLARDLRRRMGAEFRDEAEEVERLTDLQRRRKQTLAEVARRAMHAGDAATLAIGNRTWRGLIDEVGSDYVKVHTGTAVVEAPFHVVRLALEPTRAGGHNRTPDASTWIARLGELAMAETQLTLVIDGNDLEGRIVLVATDHLEFEASVYVAIENVRAVVRSVV
ncbi:hypothetical protein BH18ACT5_BH18ACT5_15540 [soil metagenome]